MSSVTADATVHPPGTSCAIFYGCFICFSSCFIYQNKTTEEKKVSRVTVIPATAVCYLHKRHTFSLTAAFPCALNRTGNYTQCSLKQHSRDPANLGRCSQHLAPCLRGAGQHMTTRTSVTCLRRQSSHQTANSPSVPPLIVTTHGDVEKSWRLQSVPLELKTKTLFWTYRVCLHN